MSFRIFAKIDNAVTADDRPLWMICPFTKPFKVVQAEREPRRGSRGLNRRIYLWSRFHFTTPV